MHVEEAISQYLLSVEEISEVVGTNVFALRMPQMKELPAISFRIPDKNWGQDLDGTTGTVEGSLEVDVVGFSAKQVLDLAKIVRESLDMEEGEISDPEVLDIALQSETQVFEPFPDGNDKAVFHVGLEFLIQYIPE